MSRAYLQDKQRVVIKIGTSTITHTDTGHLNLVKLEKFVRILTDILSALVAKMIGADLLILLSDIDGLYTDDPRSNPDAQFISCVEKIDEDLLSCAKGPDSAFGTGGMTTKLAAAEIANGAGTDMVIANGDDPVNVIRILEGKEVGTLFKA